MSTPIASKISSPVVFVVELVNGETHQVVARDVVNEEYDIMFWRGLDRSEIRYPRQNVIRYFIRENPVEPTG